MSIPVYIRSYAALVQGGIVTPAGTTPWESGQTGPADVTRGQVLDKPYPAFGKLSLPDRLAFSAGSLALSAVPAAERASTGISLGLPAGSLSTDLRYMESVIAGFPSPAVFSATLPSSAVADIAIVHGLKGENRVCAGGNESGLVALELALILLECGKACAMLVLSVNALEPSDFSSPLVPGDFQRENRAFAFLLGIAPEPGHSPGLPRIDATFGKGNKDQAAGSGELYFYELIRLLRDRKSGSVECDAPGISGRITLSTDA
jgi:hypothetical protein